MKKAKAITKYVRVSPRKARLAADIIRGLTIEDAMFQLNASNLKAGKLLGKTLDSAVANAETQLELRREDLKVVEVRVDEGPTMKRILPRNRGGRHPILKRMSHFTVVVGAE
jgi:large subunit ribosomal protein L22